MAVKIEIDLEKLKQLHGQGLSDREVGEKLGADGATIRLRRIDLGLAPTSRRGRRPGGNGARATTRASVASAGGNFKTRKPRQETRLQITSQGRAALHFSEAITELERRRAEIDTAIEFLNRQMAR